MAASSTSAATTTIESIAMILGTSELRFYRVRVSQPSPEFSTLFRALSHQCRRSFYNHDQHFLRATVHVPSRRLQPQRSTPQGHGSNTMLIRQEWKGFR